MKEEGRMRGLGILLVIGALVLLSYGTVSAYTEIPGGTLGDETWGPGTYYVSGDITVGVGATLTVQPGTVVKFALGRQLSVYGTLTAPGTGWGTGSFIVFTARDDNDYGETLR